MNERAETTNEDTTTATVRRRRHPVLAAIAQLVQAVFVIGLLAGGGLLAWWFNATEGTAKRSSGAAEESSRLVEVLSVSVADRPVEVRAMGTVSAAREVVLRPRVAGTIVEQSPAFEPGGTFQAGDFVLRIDPLDYEQALVQRESDLAQAEADLQIELGDQAVAREELELLEVDIPAINRDLILRIPQVNRAEAEVRSAEAAVASAKLDLERTRILAPFDGQLVERSVNVGTTVAPGDALATLIGTGRAWIELSVPVSSLRWIETPASAGGTGSPAVIRDARAWGPTGTRAGHVTRRIGRLEEGSRLAQVIVTVEDPFALETEHDGRPDLLLGAFVEVEIEGRVLPDSVVLDRNLVREGQTVWVMNGDDRLETRAVTIVHRGPDRVWITGGLADGDRVVRTNLTTPVDGMLLRAAAGDDPLDGPVVDARTEARDGQ